MRYDYSTQPRRLCIYYEEICEIENGEEEARERGGVKRRIEKEKTNMHR